jgi:type IV pilus assembly protein PilA
MSKQGCLVIATAVLALALAGCGGGDKGSNRAKAYTPPAQTGSDFQSSGGDAAQQDAEAKANARNLVTEVETCFVDNQDYGMCKEPAGTKLPLGHDLGQVEVSEAGTATYTVVAHSESGTNFEVTKDDKGVVKRSCDKAGEGGCKAGGTW